MAARAGHAGLTGSVSIGDGGEDADWLAIAPPLGRRSAPLRHRAAHAATRMPPARAPGAPPFGRLQSSPVRDGESLPRARCRSALQKVDLTTTQSPPPAQAHFPHLHDPHQHEMSVLSSTTCRYARTTPRHTRNPHVTSLLHQREKGSRESSIDRRLGDGAVWTSDAVSRDIEAQTACCAALS